MSGAIETGIRLGRDRNIATGACASAPKIKMAELSVSGQLYVVTPNILQQFDSITAHYVQTPLKS